jgi:nucleoside-diphosphate kinase
MVVSGENSISRIRELMGPTDSRKAKKGTIRGDYGVDVTVNVIHGSDSPESAKREIELFFK